MVKANFFVGLIVCLVYVTSASAQQRIFEENGGTYRETVTRVRRPVTETRLEERSRTVFREQSTTKIHDSQRTVYVPVTEYHWVPRWHGVLNPFRPRTLAYHWVPRTRWEWRTESVKVPITTRTLVPHTQTVKVPVTTTRMVEGEQITRIPIRGGAHVGGISRMETDPPRHGSGSTIRR